MKYLKYLKYLFVHKWWVAYYCHKEGLPFWVGLFHDWSKFLPDEFFPYAEYFYGGYERGKQPYSIKEAFNYAWNLHQKRNPHHWQFWEMREDSGKLLHLEMPERYMREMLADWKGAGRAITGKEDVQSWYAKNFNNIHLDAWTRCEINDRLDIWNYLGVFDEGETNV